MVYWVAVFQKVLLGSMADHELNPKSDNALFISAFEWDLDGASHWLAVFFVSSWYM